MAPKRSAAKAKVTIRRARSKDAQACGKISYAAFSTINAEHGFPCDFPSAEVTTGVLAMMFSTPGFYGVVAESGGRIVGSNCLDERAIIAGVGPITVDPSAQNLGVGRKLMDAVMNRAKERRAAGVRLVQAAFHNRSLSLYANLGFDVREPLSCMQGRPQQRSISGCKVRAAQPADLDACNALARRVHGFDRGADLASHRAGHRQGGRARRPRYGIHIAPRLFRPCDGGDQSRLAGADRVGRIFWRSRNSGAVAERGALPLVPGKRPASHAADDADERRPLQRAVRRMAAFRHVLNSADHAPYSRRQSVVALPSLPFAFRCHPEERSDEGSLFVRQFEQHRCNSPSLLGVRSSQKLNSYPAIAVDSAKYLFFCNPAATRYTLRRCER
jgi:ribosomal protein S18 acetylase RimI-like enzyme